MKLSVVAAALAAAVIIAVPVLPVAAQTQEATQPAPTKAQKPKKPPTAGQAAMHARQKKCGAEWKAAKAAGKIEKGMNWPKYWSACNKRLKGA